MRLSLYDLHETFRERTFWTDKLIADGLSSRLGVLEETLTDVNLIGISQKHSDYILTRKFTRKEEGAQSGADWLWCIGEPGAWISLLVQAKIINPSTSACRYLNYRQGKQRSFLLRFSRQYKLFPMYCIYSHIPLGFLPSSKHLPSLNETDPVEWSCSFVVPKFVRKLVNQKLRSQEDLLSYAVPWTYPFLYAASNNQQSLAIGLADAMDKVRIEFETIGTAGGRIRPTTHSKAMDSPPTSSRMSWENPKPKLLITRNPPRIVSRLMAGKIDATKAPVSGVSIISSVPIHEVVPTYTQKALPSSNSSQFGFEHIQNPSEFIQLKLLDSL